MVGQLSPEVDLWPSNCCLTICDSKMKNNGSNSDNKIKINDSNKIKINHCCCCCCCYQGPWRSKILPECLCSIIKHHQNAAAQQHHHHQQQQRQAQTMGVVGTWLTTLLEPHSVGQPFDSWDFSNDNAGYDNADNGNDSSWRRRHGRQGQDHLVVGSGAFFFGRSDGLVVDCCFFFWLRWQKSICLLVLVLFTLSAASATVWFLVLYLAALAQYVVMAGQFGCTFWCFFFSRQWQQLFGCQLSGFLWERQRSMWRRLQRRIGCWFFWRFFYWWWHWCWQLKGVCLVVAGMWWWWLSCRWFVFDLDGPSKLLVRGPRDGFSFSAATTRQFGCWLIFVVDECSN